MEYPLECTNELRHAYCATIWKYQGSETDCVTTIINSRNGLSRELLYTAVTRAKKRCHLFIDSYKLNEALQRSIRMERCTRLTEYLKYAYENPPEFRSDVWYSTWHTETDNLNNEDLHDEHLEQPHKKKVKTE